MNDYIGYFDATNCGACMVKFIDEEYIYFDIVTDKTLSKHKLKLYYNNKGIYFNFRGRTYLDDVLRIN